MDALALCVPCLFTLGYKKASGPEFVLHMKQKNEGKFERFDLNNKVQILTLLSIIYETTHGFTFNQPERPNDHGAQKCLVCHQEPGQRKVKNRLAAVDLRLTR